MMDKRGKLEKIYREKRGLLLQRVARLLDAEIAEDLLQDVVVRALANIDALEPVRDLTAWLWTACKHAVIDAWRQAGRRAAAGETHIEDFDTLMDHAWRSAPDELEREELLRALERAMAALPVEQRRVVEGQVFEGKSFRRLAAETGLAPETLAARKRYALIKLRRALHTYFEED